MGPPYIHAFVKMVDVAPQEEQLQPKDKEVLEQLYAKISETEDPEEVGKYIKYCRAKIRKQQTAADEDRARVQLACGEQMEKSVEVTILSALKVQGVQWKSGPAPKGPLERQAAQLLERMRR